MLTLLLPYVRAIVPARLRSLASILPIPPAREMKYQANLVTLKARELFERKKRELEQEGKQAIVHDEGKQDLLSIISK